MDDAVDHRSIDACPRHAQHRQRTKPSVSGAMACKHSVTKALRVADDAILICRGTRGRNGQSSVISWLIRTTMMHLVEKEKLQRANAALLKTAVCGGLAACALGAAIYDFGRWFTALVD